VKQEVVQSLATARRHLSDAKAILGLQITGVAAQQAYLAAFHAAEAFIFDRAGHGTKTHSGLRATFSRLAKDEPRISPTFMAFLARAYDLKSQADYATAPDANISREDAASAIDTAEQMIDAIAGLLGPTGVASP